MSEYTTDEIASELESWVRTATGRLAGTPERMIAQLRESVLLPAGVVQAYADTIRRRGFVETNSDYEAMQAAALSANRGISDE